MLDKLKKLGKCLLPLAPLAALGLTDCTVPVKIQEQIQKTAHEAKTCLTPPFVHHSLSASEVKKTREEHDPNTDPGLHAVIDAQISTVKDKIAGEFGKRFAAETIEWCVERTLNQSININSRYCAAKGVTFRQTDLQCFDTKLQSQIYAPFLHPPFNVLCNEDFRYYVDTHRQLRKIEKRGDFEWKGTTKDQNVGCDADLSVCLNERINKSRSPIKIDLVPDNVLEERTGIRVEPAPLFGVKIADGNEWCVWNEIDFPPLETREPLEYTLQNLREEHGNNMVNWFVLLCADDSRRKQPPVNSPLGFFVESIVYSPTRYSDFRVRPKDNSFFLVHNPADRAAAVNKFITCLSEEAAITSNQ